MPVIAQGPNMWCAMWSSTIGRLSQKASTNRKGKSLFMPLRMVVTGSDHGPELAALMSQSARLERLLALANDDGASTASTAAVSLEYEDRLHQLDAELEASRDPDAQLPLWRQRLQLLRQVAALEASRHYLASEGRSLDVALVAAY